MTDAPHERHLHSTLIAAIAACAISLSACAAGTAADTVGVERLSGSRVEQCPEDGRPLSIAAITSAEYSKRFVPTGEASLYVTHKVPAVWLRFRLDEPGSASRPGWILEVAPSFSIILDKIDLYLPMAGAAGKRTYAHQSAGAKRPPRKGEAPSRFFLFETPEKTLRAEYAYLRLESAMDVSVWINQWQPLALSLRDVRYFLAYGLIYGILLAMIAYNFFIFVSLRDRAYLYYILYVVSALLWQFHVQGHAKMLAGTHPALDLSALWVLVGAVQLWGAVFSISFLSLKRHLPRMRVVVAGLAAVGAITAAAGVAGLHRAAFDLAHFGGLTLPVVVIIAAVLRLRQGFAPARYYVFAWSVLASGGILFALMGLQILPVAFWSVNGIALGMAAESLLLSLALADRIRTLKKEKEFFEKSQKRYMELSITDGLTGLYNRRYLQSKLESEVQHSQRLGRPLSLIMLDLDDFKAVNDRNGHGFGDMVLSRLAAVIRASTREVDVACRYGGEEFVLIMPGTAKADALNTAERIRTRFAAEPFITGKKQVETVTISLGTAELQEGDTTEAFLERADSAMYRAKRLGKNRTESA